MQKRTVLEALTIIRYALAFGGNRCCVRKLIGFDCASCSFGLFAECDGMCVGLTLATVLVMIVRLV